jgi:hypothetical protein
MEKSNEKLEQPLNPFDPALPPPEADLPKVDLRKYFQKTPDIVEESMAFHRGPRSNSSRKVIAWSFTAALLDCLLLISVSCFLLIAFSFLVKAQLSLVFQILGSSAFQMACALMSGLSIFYLVLFRVFLGFTIGEWACDLRVGSLKQRLHSSYSLRVLFRTAVIFATGIFSLPLLSLIFGKDLPGVLARLPLVQLDKEISRQRVKISK